MTPQLFHIALASLALAMGSTPTPEVTAPRADADIGPIYTDPGDLPRLKVARDGKQIELPLEHTHVSAELTGFVARVEVRQTYGNPYQQPIEAIYVFPLPENSAVDDMRMVIGTRTIRADIKKREEARRTYDDAKAQGHTAALLEQERPNVFTQSVANIEPGARIDVVIRYVQDLSYDDGKYEFVFPMVVGPRFFPGEATGTQTGSGWAPDTTAVPDASRVSPPYLGRGERSGHDISIELTADAGLPITEFDVPTHVVIPEQLPDGRLHLTLADDDSIPNRDFILRYGVASALPQATVLTHGVGGAGFFTLVVQPPKLELEELVGRRELIFVVDVSGSMSGVPLAMAKDAMREAMRMVRPVDTFNVMVFAGRAGQAFAASRPANAANLREAAQYIDGLTAGGGTQMLDGVKAALTPSVEPGRHRYVFFMTDGYVGNEQQIIDQCAQLVGAIEQRGGRARVFGFGVGSSVNRFLLDGLSKSGKGTTVYASTREDPTLAAQTFFRFVDHPVLEDLEIDWGDGKVSEVFPRKTPDVFASRPTLLHGRYAGSGKTTITVRGTMNGKRMSLTVTVEFPREEAENGALSTLWARAKIESIERELWDGPRPALIDEITALGIEHRIVTAYTSFVAVDTSKRVGGKLSTIVQPAEAPEGVDMAMAAPSVATNKAMRLSGSGAALMGGGSGQAMGYGGLGTMGSGQGGGGSIGMGGAGVTRGIGTVSVGSGKKDAPTPTAPATVRKSREAEDKGEADRAPTQVQGALAPEVLMRVLAAKKGRLLALMQKHGSEARVVFRLVIDGEGKVQSARILRSSIVDGEFQRAFLAELRTLKFPRPAGGGTVEVTYPLSLP